MREYYAVADVVICRGSAGSLNEVCANGVPSVVIPKANLLGIIRPTMPALWSDEELLE